MNNEVMVMAQTLKSAYPKGGPLIDVLKVTPKQIWLD